MVGSTSGPVKADPPAMLPMEGSPQPCALQMAKGPAFPVFTCPQHSRLQCRKHCHKPRELAAFQALKLTTQAVSFMEIDSLIYVWEVLGTLWNVAIGIA